MKTSLILLGLVLLVCIKYLDTARCYLNNTIQEEREGGKFDQKIDQQEAVSPNLTVL